MLSATLIRAEMQVDSATSAVALIATVQLVDDVLGPVGLRQHVVQDEVLVAQVLAFADAMLPTLSSAIGVTVALP